MKSEALFTRMRPDEIEELRSIAERLDVPMAQIVREAVRQYIAALKEGAGHRPALTEIPASGE